VREIARDESGYEGEKLVGGVTDVLAHAGVHLSTAAAADCVGKHRAARRRRSDTGRTRAPPLQGAAGYCKMVA